MPDKHQSARMSDAWTQFRSLFGWAEDKTRQLLKESDRLPSGTFKERVRQLAADRKITRAAEEVFIRAADLRNLNGHGQHSANDPIAIPALSFVATFAQACEELGRTGTLSKLFRKKIRAFDESAPLHDALNFMHKNEYSQVVVKMNSGVFTLLVTDDIASWLMSKFKEEVVALDSTIPISEAIPVTKSFKTYSFMRIDGLMREAQNIFRNASKGPDRFYAIVLTESGQSTDVPLGIITGSDLLGLEK